MKILSFAVSNVGRNRQRTLVTTGALAFAGFIMLFYASLMEGFLQTIERTAVGMDLGEIQIHVKGYRDNPDLYQRIENPDGLIQRLESAGLSASPRLYGYGLAASGSASSGVGLRGVDLRREPAVTQIHRHVMQGAWLDEAEPDGVVIGRKLARTLGAGTGDELVIVTQAADGSMANRLYRVRGILKSVAEGLDRSAVFMTDRALRDLLVLPDGAHEIAVVRRDAALDLKTATARAAGAAAGLEVLNWRQLQPVLSTVIDISGTSLIFMILITYTAVGMVTLNAMLMSVFERIHEFGVMKAIGVSPGQVIALIFTEAMIQTAAAVALALAFGLPVSFYYQTHGIDLSGWTGTGTIMGVALEPVWYCRVTPATVIMPVAFLFIIAALAVVYPAVKAAVIRPVQAIYHR
jgi:ABC-type lipoprotein release transport system permease subunit